MPEDLRRPPAAASRIRNLFTDAVSPDQGERFDILLQHRNLVVERIVSSAHITPQTWAQPQDEWVLLLSGQARMQVDGQTVDLVVGDSLFLPAGLPHSVLRTAEGTTWLAVHLHPTADTPGPSGDALAGEADA